MNPLDWLLIALLAYSVVKAFLQGFFREAFALGGLVIGLLLASWGYESAALHLNGLIASPPIAPITTSTAANWPIYPACVRWCMTNPNAAIA